MRSPACIRAAVQRREHQEPLSCLIVLCRTCLQGSEVPDILPLSHSTPYSGGEGDPPGFNGAGQQAQELTQQACQGTEPALALPLPHARAMQGKRGGAAALRSRHCPHIPFAVAVCVSAQHCPQSAWALMRHIIDTEEVE